MSLTGEKILLDIENILNHFCISESIFQHLNVSELASCQLVNKFWKNLITNKAFWVEHKLNYAKNMKKIDFKTHKTRTVVDVYPSFAKVLDYVIDNEPLGNRRIFANALNRYFHCQYLSHPFRYIFKISFFTRFTISKSQFSQNSHFQSLIFQKIHIFQASNSW